MIDRYTRPEMRRIWSDQNKYQQWLEVELATAEALAQTKDVPPDAARLLRKHASFNVQRIQEIDHGSFRKPGRRRRGWSVTLAALRPYIQ
jgi:adenylosuccinate lyase